MKQRFSQRLSQALDRLADLFENGHLEACTDPASFIDRVCAEIETSHREIHRLRYVIQEFCERSCGAADAWQQQPHIAALFAIASEELCES